MTYTNLHAAAASLGQKLYTFAGHTINPTHTAFAFNQMAKALDHTKREPACVSVNFYGTLYIDGKAVPVTVSVAGTGIFDPVEVSMQMA